jgi:hypothetical protein
MGTLIRVSEDGCAKGPFQFEDQTPHGREQVSRTAFAHQIKIPAITFAAPFLIAFLA